MLEGLLLQITDLAFIPVCLEMVIVSHELEEKERPLISVLSLLS